MPTLCKIPFSPDLIKLYLACFVSVFIHLIVFSNRPALLSTSSFEKLLGKTGGQEQATEISFFPVGGSSKRERHASPVSPLDVPSRPSEVRTSASKTESAGVPSRGIGQGGSSTSYASVLHAYLDSAKVFPRALKDLGVSGVVKVRFQVTSEGHLEDIRLAESEASPLLQQEALRFLKKLENVPVPPTNLTSQQLQFELPLRYELKS